MLEDIQTLCRRYAKSSAMVWVDISLDPNSRASDRIACSKLIVDYALLGLDVGKHSDGSLKDLKIEIKGLSNGSSR